MLEAGHLLWVCAETNSIRIEFVCVCTCVVCMRMCKRMHAHILVWHRMLTCTHTGCAQRRAVPQGRASWRRSSSTKAGEHRVKLQAPYIVSMGVCYYVLMFTTMSLNIYLSIDTRGGILSIINVVPVDKKWDSVPSWCPYCHGNRTASQTLPDLAFLLVYL